MFFKKNPIFYKQPQKREVVGDSRYGKLKKKYVRRNNHKNIKNRKKQIKKNNKNTSQKPRETKNKENSPKGSSPTPPKVLLGTEELRPAPKDAAVEAVTPVEAAFFQQSRLEKDVFEGGFHGFF